MWPGAIGDGTEEEQVHASVQSVETHRNQNAVMGAFVRPKTEEHSGAAVAMERSGATQKRKVSEGMGTEQGTGRTANATRGGKARRTQTVASNGAEAGSSSDTTSARRHEGDGTEAAAGRGGEAEAEDRCVAIADTGDGAAGGSGTVDESMRGSAERTRVVGGKRGREVLVDESGRFGEWQHFAQASKRRVW